MTSSKTLSDTYDDLLRNVCDNLKDQFPKLVMADYLADIGDERAEAWQWIAENNLYPNRGSENSFRFRWIIHKEGSLWSQTELPINFPHLLPPEFSGLVTGGMVVSSYASSPNELYDRLANEFIRIAYQKCIKK